VSAEKPGDRPERVNFREKKDEEGVEGEPLFVDEAGESAGHEGIDKVRVNGG